MQSYAKVFILSSKGTSPYCVDDTKTLMETLGIRDIITGNFVYTNFSGLTLEDHPIFAVPGGSAIQIEKEVSEIMPNIQDNIQNQINILGICAGAYDFADQMNLYRTDYSFNLNGFNPPEFSSSTANESIGIACGYDALGPFYPNSNYAFRMCMNSELKPEMLAKAGSHVPIAAKINCANTGKTLTQLYLQGPALVENISNTSSQIKANFCDSANYSFSSHSGTKTFLSKEVGAVVTRPVNHEKKQGGLALWSTHPEAAVPDSKLLKFFKDENKINLLPKWHEAIVKDNPETIKYFATTIKETFKI